MLDGTMFREAIPGALLLKVKYVLYINSFQLSATAFFQQAPLTGKARNHGHYVRTGLGVAGAVYIDIQL